MVSFKSTLLNATLAITAALPLAAAGLFTSTGSAQAAALVGDLSFGGGSNNATLKTNSLTFNTPNTFAIDTSSSTGSFTAFTQGTIGNILSFAPTSATNPFLDLGTNAATIADNLNTFAVTSATYTLTQVTPNLVSINVITDGFFKSMLGDISQGQGIFTLQAKGTLADVTADLNTGVTATYSGLYFTSVPEPAALLGLGAVGAVMVMSRRRKSFAQ
ncbi:PEP-CTERM sorting domain-containing protein [Nostoc sp.]|uniref:PEP-CTERM sorting domain-containing protein n=1 Tax=Nostoc sp. TaxID=1180 RepID=UPI002FFA94EB